MFSLSNVKSLLMSFCLYKDAALNAASQILRLTRAGETAWGELPGNDWTVFQANHSTYEPLEWASRNDNFQINDSEYEKLQSFYSSLDIFLSL